MGGIIATGESVIDSGLVTELVNLVKTVMGLFTEFPLNVLLIASLCFVAPYFIFPLSSFMNGACLYKRQKVNCSLYF